jgi:tRNA pseudouridine55 synthase
MDGIINLLKTAAMGSSDCVMNLRRFSGERRIGHAGTLDPNAAGVLPLALGKATRLIEYMEGSGKAYFCRCRFGYTSDTQDIWGNVVRTGSGMPSEAAVREALETFQGEIQQVPPKFSALKVNGRRAYDLARAGEEFELAARTVTVHSIEFRGYDAVRGELAFWLSCSKGTYVRTICDDLGKKLGCGAVMSFLLRTASGGFELADAVTLEELSAGPDAVLRYLKPVDSAVSSLKKVFTPSEDREKAFWNGNSFYLKGQNDYLDGSVCAVYGQIGFLGTAKASVQADKTVFTAEKVIK